MSEKEQESSVNCTNFSGQHFFEGTKNILENTVLDYLPCHQIWVL